MLFRVRSMARGPLRGRAPTRLAPPGVPIEAAPPRCLHGWRRTVQPVALEDIAAMEDAVVVAEQHVARLHRHADNVLLADAVDLVEHLPGDDGEIAKVDVRHTDLWRGRFAVNTAARARRQSATPRVQRPQGLASGRGCARAMYAPKEENAGFARQPARCLEARTSGTEQGRRSRRKRAWLWMLQNQTGRPVLGWRLTGFCEFSIA